MNAPFDFGGWEVALDTDTNDLVDRPVPEWADTVRTPCLFTATLTFAYRGVPVFVMRTHPQADQAAIEFATLASRPEEHPLMALIADANTQPEWDVTVDGILRRKGVAVLDVEAAIRAVGKP